MDVILNFKLILRFNFCATFLFRLATTQIQEIPLQYISCNAVSLKLTRMISTLTKCYPLPLSILTFNKVTIIPDSYQDICCKLMSDEDFDTYIYM